MIFLLHHAVQRSAERHADREAFRCGDEGISYGALDQKASQLAHLLRDAGVRRGDRVGIYLNKSLHTPVALYGIMRAGAAYVPLDPTAPAPRLRQVIRHCGIRHLVTHPPRASGLQAVLEEPTGLAFLVGAQADLGLPAASWNDVDAASIPGPPDVGLTELDLAYIMYTSGSSGDPKGIMHTHGSGLSYARASAETYAVRGDDRLSNHSPLHFDMSTFDYFTGPLCGATTVIIPEAYAKLPASLSQLMQDERLTIWYSVPFALTQLLLRGVLDKRNLESLRWVLFGGEPFPPQHLRALMQRWSHARFSNVYGPAEVNQCTYYHVPPADGDADEPIPIGRIWPNAEGLIVDEHDQPVARGESGELLVRTPTMMRGYWQQPDLNSRAFYRREVTADVHDVFYRTGDLVAERADGHLKFLGRKDRQIKTRGHRVELDEVESAFASHPQVEEAAAYVIPDHEGSQQIVAAVVLKHSEAATEEQLHEHAARALPAYAMPEFIEVKSEFPRTTSGKIDRRRLRDDALAVSNT